MEQVTEQTMEELVEEAVEKLPILLIPQLWIRLLCIGVFVVLLWFFFSPMLIGIRHAGCYAGCVVCVTGIVFFALNPLISGWLDHFWKDWNGRVPLCILFGTVCACVLYGIVISGCMIHAMKNKPKSDYPVVLLGCKVRGTSPSLMLKRRLDAACDYLQANPNAPVIVCGGRGADEEISEADCMADYLIQNGIAESRIYREDKSTSTRENLNNAREILERELLDYHVTIITDGFHQFRAAMIAKDVGLTSDAVSAKTSWYLLPSYWVREWIAVAGYLIFG